MRRFLRPLSRRLIKTLCNLFLCCDRFVILATNQILCKELLLNHLFRAHRYSLRDTFLHIGWNLIQCQPMSVDVLRRFNFYSYKCIVGLHYNHAVTVDLPDPAT